jgi:phenylacetate-CoA ligase
MSAAPRDSLTRDELTCFQAERLTALLREALPGNGFYARKFAAAGLDPAAVGGYADLKRLPFTTKAELLADQADRPPYGTVLTYPVDRYRRFCQTSGTSGRPLRWLDTAESWTWMLDNWAAIYRIAGVQPGERLFFPFSFGPFLGFWTAFDAASRYGCLCLPGGGMSSTARLRFLAENEAAVVLCTPTYALRLAEAAREEGMDLLASSVRALILAGEPGGSIPGTRGRIEAAWGARVFDHTGMTEVGPMAVECVANPGGLHVLETEFIVEVIDPTTGDAVPPGTEGELVVTNLGRLGSPLLRYRTGDLVCIDPAPCPCGRTLARLLGGIRGRADDMIVLRGNNVHPSALQTILHRFVEVAEYRIEVDRAGSLPVLRIDVEAQTEGNDLATRIAQAVRDELLFRAEVRAVAPGSLPRFEHKAQRFVRNYVNDGTPERPT